MHSIRSTPRTARNLLESSRKIPTPVQNRTFFFRTIRSVLKLRYIVYGAGVYYGLVYLNEQFPNWKKCLSPEERQKLDAILPSEETKQQISTVFNDLKAKVEDFEIDPEIKETAKEHFKKGHKWLSQQLEKMTVVDDSESSRLKSKKNDRNENSAEKFTKRDSTSMSLSSNFLNDSTQKGNDKNQRKIVSKNENPNNDYCMNQKLIKIQLNHQKQLEKLQLENKILRQKLFRSSCACHEPKCRCPNEETAGKTRPDECSKANSKYILPIPSPILCKDRRQSKINSENCSSEAINALTNQVLMTPKSPANLNLCDVPRTPKTSSSRDSYCNEIPVRESVQMTDLRPDSLGNESRTNKNKKNQMFDRLRPNTVREETDGIAYPESSGQNKLKNDKDCCEVCSTPVNITEVPEGQGTIITLPLDCLSNHQNSIILCFPDQNRSNNASGADDIKLVLSIKNCWRK